MDEVVIATIRDRIDQLRELDKRREAVISSIEKQDKLTPELMSLIVSAQTLAELEEALAARCDRIMLDNFSLEQIAAAVALAHGRVELEVSGNVSEGNLLAIAQTGVDFISIGALTKDCKALDLSMRLL